MTYEEVCEQIIKQEGRCVNIDCEDCPFNIGNDCVNAGYAIRDIAYNKKDPLLLKSCIEYLKNRSAK